MGLVHSQRERDLVADALGDSPETVIPTHLLRRGLASAYVEGSVSRFNGMIVQSHSSPREPWCFGSDPDAVWRLLRELDEWGRQPISPNVSADLAVPLSALVEQDANLQVRHYGDVYHTLPGRIKRFTTPEVRPLDLADHGLVAAHESNPHRMGFITFEDLLTNGAAAGAVVDNRLVALAHTNAMTARITAISECSPTKHGVEGDSPHPRRASWRTAFENGGGFPFGALGRTTRHPCAWPPNSAPSKHRDASTSTS